MSQAQDLLSIETMLKLAAIHKLLVDKGLLTNEEVLTEMTTLSKSLAEEMNKAVDQAAKDTGSS